MSNSANPQRKKKSAVIQSSLARLSCLSWLLQVGSALRPPRNHMTHSAPRVTPSPKQPSSQLDGRPATDLASFHTAQGTRCIDCHSGRG